MDFQRKREGFRFMFGGMKVNLPADALPDDKYALAVNVRSYVDGEVRTRPGMTQLYTTPGGFAPTDINTFTTIPENANPTLNNPVRILSRDIQDNIFLDGAGGTPIGPVGTLAGGGASPGCSMIPFRPNESPLPWMYIANGSDYQKFPAPLTTTASITPQGVGIAEPRVQPEAVLEDSGGNGCLPLYEFHGAPAFTSGGTAGATSGGNRITDTAVTAFFDPNAVTLGTLGVVFPMSLQVSSTVGYSIGMMIQIIGGFSRVIDVFPSVGTNLPITSIFYFSGNTGRCVIVPSLSTDQGPDVSIYGPRYLANLRRGALIKIGTETCFVWSVAIGPDNSIAIETFTNSTHTTAEVFTSVPAISIMSSLQASTFPYIGASIQSFMDTFTVTTGIGTITATPLFGFAVGGSTIYQAEDYIHLSIRVDHPENLTEAKILFDVDDGTFTKNFYYYTIRQADIQQAIVNAATQLAAAQGVTQKAIIDEEAAIASANQGVTFSSAQAEGGQSQWSEIFFPATELTRVGNDQSKSLLTLSKMQILFNASATISVAVSGIYLSGTNQPDVGDVGAPYLYRFRGRSSITGARSNPSPETRYGLSARRQFVKVIIPNGGTPYDNQIDTWDIFRYGGSVTSWRYVGSVQPSPFGPTIYTDNFGDDAVGAGEELEFDNFEPWPSVDVPLANSSVVSAPFAGTVTVVTVTPPTNILRYLPGTQVRFPQNSGNVYTLRTRPTLVSGTDYLLEFVECCIVSGGPVQIIEPLLARQTLPYMWGPDVAGTVFACGDNIRSGTIYFSKGNTPDAAPDKFNVEICPPSEPLLGGEILDGLSFVASSNRWWALYFQANDPVQRYAFVQQPFLRGLAAPFGHCNDGRSIYWWAPDGIWSSSEGSLTDADLSTLFPHDGAPGVPYTYNNFTVNPPDYTQCSKFRLEYCNGYLYALYPPVGGTTGNVTLVYDLHRKAWSVDSYNNINGATCYKTIIQKVPEGGAPYASARLLIGGTIGPIPTQGAIYQQTELHNDNASDIIGVLSTKEFDGGDIRAPKQWGDFFLDVQPVAAIPISVSPVSIGAPLTTSTIPVATSGARTRLPYNMLPFNGSKLVISDFFGLFMIWGDDFRTQTAPTTLFSWQPSFVIQPAKTVGWQTFGGTFGLKGFMHVRQVLIAYVSTAPITISILPTDGQAPPQVTLPSSNGALQKLTFPVGPNKGVLFSFNFISQAPFQIFEDQSEIWVGEWGRPDEYTIFRTLGGNPVESGPI